MFDDIDCMFVIRSAPHIPSQGNFVREQMNQKTSFLDLSQVQFWLKKINLQVKKRLYYKIQVYGATEEELRELIDSDGMHMKTRRGFDGANGPVGDILPFTQATVQ